MEKILWNYTNILFLIMHWLTNFDTHWCTLTTNIILVFAKLHFSLVLHLLILYCFHTLFIYLFIYISIESFYWDIWDNHLKYWDKYLNIYWDIYFIHWVLIHYYTFLLYWNDFLFNHWLLWNLNQTPSFFKHFLPFWHHKIFRLILCFPFPNPGI